MKTWCFTQLLFVNFYVVLILFQITAEFRVASTLTTPGSQTKFKCSRRKWFCTLFSFCFSYCLLAPVPYRSWVAFNAQNNDDKRKYREQNSTLEQKAMTGTVQSMAQEKDIAAWPIWPPQRFKTLGAGPTRKIWSSRKEGLTSARIIKYFSPYTVMVIQIAKCFCYTQTEHWNYCFCKYKQCILDAKLNLPSILS